MAALQHDSQGFLMGSPIGMGRALSAWNDIRVDVRAIRQAVMGSAKGQRFTPGQQGDSRATVTPATRDSAGRFVRRDAPGAASDSRPAVLPTGRTKSAIAQAAVQPATRRTSSPVTPMDGSESPSGRDERGRFSGGTSDGRGAERAGDGVLRGLLDRLTGAASSTGGALENADPAVKAFQEVAQPLARGYGMLTGNRDEKRKEGWFRRIYGSLAGFRKEESVFNKAANKSLKNLEDKPVGGGADSDGGFWSKIFGSSLLTAFIPIIAAIGAGLVAIAPIIAAALAVALAVWLAKKALESPAAQKAKADFNKGMDEQKSPAKYAPPLLGESGRRINDPRRIDRDNPVGPDGRNINDPRRLDLSPPEPEPVLASSTPLKRDRLGRTIRPPGYTPSPGAKLPPAESVAQSAGRFVGGVGQLFKKGSSGQRALETGTQYSAGNIGGLDDAQTRALVASTVMTESRGGKLDVINEAGYMGRYQAGAGWLADAGLIKGGGKSVNDAMVKDGFKNEYKWGKSGGMTRFLQDDKNWHAGMSYKAYLESAEAQDAAFKTNSDAAYKSLMANPRVKDKSPENIAGLLKARHIAGMGGALQVASGGTGAVDANGTSARKYYDDVAKDKSGFLAAYSGGNAVSARPVPAPAQTVYAPIPRAPSFAAPPPIADAPPVINPLGTGADSKKSITVSLAAQDVGQDVRSRGIAHVATGGLSGGSGFA